MLERTSPWCAKAIAIAVSFVAFAGSVTAGDVGSGAPVTPSLTAFNGVRVDLAGRSAREAIDRLYAAARTGDAATAFELYKIESMCEEADRNDLLLKTVVGMNDAVKQSLFQQVAASRKACRGVTPAQKHERLDFLGQAARAGIHDAMFAYRLEGPDGDRQADPSFDDPAVSAWRDTAHAYLLALAEAGEVRAWSVLALEYARTDRVQAIQYDSAILFRNNPAIAPLKVNYIAALTAGLTFVQVDAAVERGRALAARFPRQGR